MCTVQPELGLNEHSDWAAIVPCLANKYYNSSGSSSLINHFNSHVILIAYFH